MAMTQEFILDTLLPYKENPKLCGYDYKNEECCYLTKDGKKCAVGKHMKEGPWQNYSNSFEELIESYTPEEFLTDEAFEQNIPTYVWQAMQEYHDFLATDSIKDTINDKVNFIEKETGFDLSPLKF